MVDGTVDNHEMTAEEARAKGLYFHDGRWITHAEAKNLLDKHYVSKDVRRLANYYFILIGSVGIATCSVMTYLALSRSGGLAPYELPKLAILATISCTGVGVGIGLRKFKSWARILGLVYYPALLAGLFVTALITGALEGKVLAGLALIAPVAISFGVLSYLTLYGEGAEKVFHQS
jgi:hypothetical protein